MKPIIEVDSISKMYVIGHQQRASDTLKDTLAQVVRKPFTLFRGQKLEHERLWALKDVSFQVKQGEIIGIIGRNGSGKSTLLKILSRITDPTSGKAILRGRVASLLEVGTGFHPELTGRENIFLNGAILGMTKKEIAKKFAEIVEFSGVEKFLDTPVKFYSSGMYVRLAFSVAAHLEPDILIVDEVLAVGDADFQKKSLGKMQDVTKSHDRTVLFVSHNLTAIQNICNRVIVLDQGQLIFEGRPRDGVLHYLGSSASVTGYANFKKNETRKKLWFEAVELLDNKGKRRGEYRVGEPINVNADYGIGVEGKNYQFAIELWNQEGVSIFSTTNFDTNPNLRQRSVPSGSYRAHLSIPTKDLREGQYYLTLSASIPGTEMLDEIHNAISFNIEGDADMKRLNQNRNGVVYYRLDWDNERRS